VAAVASGCESVDELIAQADQALYDAKHDGRNRTRIAEDEPATDGKPPLRVIQGRT